MGVGAVHRQLILATETRMSSGLADVRPCFFAAFRHRMDILISNLYPGIELNGCIAFSLSPSLFHSVPLCSPVSQDSPQIPIRSRLLSDPERFTFGSVSSGRGTEEESSSCFDYTSDQVSLCCV